MRRWPARCCMRAAGDAAARIDGERGLLPSDLFPHLRRLANPRMKRADACSCPTADATDALGATPGRDAAGARGGLPARRPGCRQIDAGARLAARARRHRRRSAARPTPWSSVTRSTAARPAHLDLYRIADAGGTGFPGPGRAGVEARCGWSNGRSAGAGSLPAADLRGHPGRRGRGPARPAARPAATTGRGLAGAGCQHDGRSPAVQLSAFRGKSRRYRISKGKLLQLPFSSVLQSRPCAGCRPAFAVARPVLLALAWPRLRSRPMLRKRAACSRTATRHARRARPDRARPTTRCSPCTIPTAWSLDLSRHRAVDGNHGAPAVNGVVTDGAHRPAGAGNVARGVRPRQCREPQSRLEGSGAGTRLVLDLRPLGKAARPVERAPETSVAAMTPVAPVVPDAKLPADAPASRPSMRRRRTWPWSRARRRRGRCATSVGMPAQRKLVIAIDAGHGGKDPGAHRPERQARKERHPGRWPRELAAQINADPGMKAVPDPRRRRLHPAAGSLPAGARRPGRPVHFHPCRCRREQRRQRLLGLRAVDPRRLVAGRALAGRQGKRRRPRRWRAARRQGQQPRQPCCSTCRRARPCAPPTTSPPGAGLAQARRQGAQAEVERANFVVLRSPDVPSMLVETGFITNPGEETNAQRPRLPQAPGQRDCDGVRQYFSDQPPPGTWYAARQAQAEAPQQVQPWTPAVAATPRRPRASMWSAGARP